MATSYTSLLGFALPVTGELDGTWGTTVNDSITKLVEDSIAGVATNSVAAGDWTLTTTGSGAANQARCAIIIPTGSPGVSRNIVAPSQSKAYIVINQSDAAVVFKGSATTGVTIAAGAKVLVAWNASDFVQVSGDLVGPSSATDNAVVRFDGTTGKLVQNSAVTIADTTGDITGGKYNKVTITAPASSATLTIADGKVASFSNSITFSGTDSTTMTFPSTSAAVVGAATTQTLSNKRIDPRAVAAAATSGSLTPNGDTTDLYNALSLSGAITLLAPSGTPVDGQKLLIRLKDNGTARGITWTTSAGAYRAVGITLPTTTVLGKVTYVGCVYNSGDSYWDAVATVTEA